MKWSELSIHTTHEAVEPISNILHEAGASGVVIEDPLDLIKERENVYGKSTSSTPMITQMRVSLSKHICRLTVFWAKL